MILPVSLTKYRLEVATLDDNHPRLVTASS